MTESLYDLLGVGRKATTDELKRGYRRAAKSAHPDQAGGSEDLMKRVNAAFRILTDARARDKYDRTGNAESPEPDQRNTKAIQFAFQTVCEALNAVEKQGYGDFGAFDVIAAAEQSVKRRIGELNERMRTNKRELKKARRVAKAFRAKKKGEPSKLGRLFEERANDIERGFRLIEDDIAIMELARGYLRDETFVWEDEKAAPATGLPKRLQALDLWS